LTFGIFIFRDEFAVDCPLQRRVINEPVLALGSRYDEISIFA
jgi:hypothetical protein